MDQSEIRAVCVVSPTLEIENLAVAPDAQGQGYGRALINYLLKVQGSGCHDRRHRRYIGKCPFYEACGFEYTHKIKIILLTIIVFQFTKMENNLKINAT